MLYGPGTNGGEIVTMLEAQAAHAVRAVKRMMRERVTASRLTDLRSLLQRDLNDQRVAQDLIPYLQGVNSQIGFFPAILAAIVPKGYLSAATPVAYPRPTEDGPKRICFGDCWFVEYFAAGKPVGLFKFVKSKADIIVLDGQHRANAFRCSRLSRIAVWLPAMLQTIADHSTSIIESIRHTCRSVGAWPSSRLKYHTSGAA